MLPPPKLISESEWKEFWLNESLSKETEYDSFFANYAPAKNKIYSVGPYFLMIANYTTMQILAIKGNIKCILGYDPDQVLNGGIQFLVNIIHPDDSEKLFGFSVYFQNFLVKQPAEKRLMTKASLNFRLRKADGTYLPVLEQSVGLHQNEQGIITHALKYFTDVSHLGFQKMTLSVVDDNDNDSQAFHSYTIDERLPETQPMEMKIVSENFNTLSSREIEVMKLAATGLTTNQIADRLFLSSLTVQTHRKNLLRKTQVKNSSELVRYATLFGLV